MQALFKEILGWSTIPKLFKSTLIFGEIRSLQGWVRARTLNLINLNKY